MLTLMDNNGANGEEKRVKKNTLADDDAEDTSGR